MNARRKRCPAELLRGFFLLGHPGPCLLYVFAVTVFALFASGPHIDWKVVILLVAAHLAMQFAIGVTNDYCDRQRDRLSKKNKPIVQGLVLPREALVAAFLLMFIMVLLLIPLNPPVLLVALLYLACMQSYNLGLKGTPLSGLVFALGTPLIPIYAYVGVGAFGPSLLWWQIPVAALLGVAVNLANSLPDIQEDAATGAHTLAVVLGVKGSLAACSLLALLAAIIIGVLAMTGVVAAQLWILLPTLLFVLLAVGILFLTFSAEKSHKRLKIYFYLFTLLCLVLATGWIISAVDTGQSQ